MNASGERAGSGGPGRERRLPLATGEGLDDDASIAPDQLDRRLAESKRDDPFVQHPVENLRGDLGRGQSLYSHMRQERSNPSTGWEKRQRADTVGP